MSGRNSLNSWGGGVALQRPHLQVLADHGPRPPSRFLPSPSRLLATGSGLRGLLTVGVHTEDLRREEEEESWKLGWGGVRRGG